jgi:hypothetical protein
MKKKDKVDLIRLLSVPLYDVKNLLAWGDDEHRFGRRP